MGFNARDLKNDDTTDAGFDLVMDNIAALSGDVGVTKIMFGLAGANDGLVDSTTPLPVEVIDVTNTMVADVGSIKTAVEIIDDPVFVDDAPFTLATSSVMVGGAIRDDTLSALTAVEGDAVPLRVDANGALHVLVNGTVTVGEHDVTNAGIFVVQEDGDALTALQLIDNMIVVEDVAADADPSGSLGMSVRDDEVGSTAITDSDGDIQSLRSDKFGALKTTQLPDATSEVKYAVINAASGDNTIVAAAGVGVKIRVLNLVLIAGGTTDCRFESNAGGTALTGIMKLVANSGFAPGFCPVGLFETADNELLNLECTGDIDGWLVFVEV